MTKQLSVTMAQRMAQRICLKALLLSCAAISKQREQQRKA